MSDYKQAIIIWFDANITQSKYCPLLKKAFVKIFAQEWDRATFLDNAAVEISAQNDFSANSYSYRTLGLELFAFTSEEECAECIEENRDKRIFFIVTFSSGKRIVPKMIKKYPQALPKSDDGRVRSIYLFRYNSPDIDKLWSQIHAEYLFSIECEMDLVKKLVNDIACYFSNLGQKQYDFGTPESIRQSLEYYDWAQIILGRVFGSTDAWQCKETTRELDKLISQSRTAIPQLSDIDWRILSSAISDGRKAEVSNSVAQVSFNATSYPFVAETMDVQDHFASPEASNSTALAQSTEKSLKQPQESDGGKQCRAEIPVYLRAPSIQTESFKNLHKTLQYLFNSNLVPISDVQHYSELCPADDTALIVQTFSNDDDRLVLDKICSMYKSISVYLLGVEPDTVNGRRDFYTKYPQVCALSNNPNELASKLTLDVILKTRVMGDRYAKKNEKECANIMYDQCIGLLNRLNILSINKMDNQN